MEPDWKPQVAANCAVLPHGLGQRAHSVGQIAPAIQPCQRGSNHATSVYLYIY